MFIQDFQYTGDYAIAFDCPDGEHGVKILDAKETTTKKGVPMIAVKLLVNDSNFIPYIERLVSGDYFQCNMSRFFDAFKIVRGNFDFPSWRGKLGRGVFRHEKQTYIGKDGMERTVNKAIMKELLVEQPNAQGFGQQSPQGQSQTPVNTAQTQPQAYGQPQAQMTGQTQTNAQCVPPNMEDFDEDIPF